MTEVWLHPNRRILLLTLIPIALVAMLGVLLLLTTSSGALRVIGGLCVAAAVGLILGLVGELRKPRIAYRDGQVLFFLRAGAPVAVPRNFVEAFFLGQGEAGIPLQSLGSAETVNLVARISQQAPEWQQIEVKPALGRWCDGYVTIRGTWCEPLTSEVIRRLNHRLGELSRQPIDIA